MTEASTEGASSPDESSTASYIRGGAGTVRTSENAVRIATVALLVALLGLAVTYAVHAHHVNSRRDLLHDHGVPVTATVTSCLGTATGTGITVDSFTCRGTFTLKGDRYTSVIGESTAHLQSGQRVAVVVDPSNPSVMSTAAAAKDKRAEASAYDQAIVYVGAFLLVLIFALWWPRRGGRRAGAPADAVPDIDAEDSVPATVDSDAVPTDAMPDVAAEVSSVDLIEPALTDAVTAVDLPAPEVGAQQPVAADVPVARDSAAPSASRYRTLAAPAAVLVGVVALLVIRNRRKN